MLNGGKMKRKAAFTLAEVLITLGVIGIVAAMTLPAIIQKNQKTTAVTRIKKYYTLTLQSFQRAQIDTDPDGLIMLSYLSKTSDEDREAALSYFVNNYIKPYFKIVNDLGFITPSNAGLPNYKALNGSLDSDAFSFYNAKKRIFVLADGTVLAVGVGGDDSTKLYPVLYFDINGNQQPNTVGKDVFCIVAFFPQKNSIKFFTLDKQKSRTDYLSTCNKNAGTIDSRTCGALIQHDGWQMKDDYPW